MGQSTDAILAYGYDIGGEDAGWQLADLGEFDEWTPPWSTALEEDSINGLEDDADAALLATVGEFTEPYPQHGSEAEQSAFRERRQRARDKVGVKLIAYVSGTAPRYLVSACTFEARRGHVISPDLPRLEIDRVVQGWDAKLTAALAALDLKPLQPRPQWLLVSYWGL